jgi:hypothetical protein
MMNVVLRMAPPPGRLHDIAGLLAPS